GRTVAASAPRMVITLSWCTGFSIFCRSRGKQELLLLCGATILLICQRFHWIEVASDLATTTKHAHTSRCRAPVIEVGSYRKNRATVRLSCRSMISSWPAPSPPSLNNSTEYLPSVSDTMPLPDSLPGGFSQVGHVARELTVERQPQRCPNTEDDQRWST